MKEKIYISGGITNNPNYKEQFKAAEDKLKNEYVVLSPTVITAELTWDEYMTIDFAMVSVCDCIFMLKGWEQSKGAKAELSFAKERGLKVIYE